MIQPELVLEQQTSDAYNAICIKVNSGGLGQSLHQRPKVSVGPR